MLSAARQASEADLPELLRLYRRLERELAALEALWPAADGLPEPVAESLAELLRDPESYVAIGTIDEVPLGFIWMHRESLLPQAQDASMAVVRLVFVEPEARGVGIGESLITLAMDRFRQLGCDLFDAYVTPGHRLAKNFFESHGFSARRIVMHHSENPAWQ